MKKKIAITNLLLVLLCSMLMLFGCGNSSEEGNAQKVEDGSESGYEGDGGGNPNKADKEDKGKVVSILVNGDEYIYENKPISLDSIIDMVKEIDEEFYVELNDNNATHKAYSNLVDELEELEITIEEAK